MMFNVPCSDREQRRPVNFAQLLQPGAKDSMASITASSSDPEAELPPCSVCTGRTKRRLKCLNCKRTVRDVLCFNCAKDAGVCKRCGHKGDDVGTDTDLRGKEDFEEESTRTA